MGDNRRDTSNVWGLDGWIIRCESCGYEDISYDLSDMGGYGRALGRTSLGELAELGFETPVYEELIQLLRDVMGQVALGLFLNCRDRLFGLIVDPAPSGERYDFVSRPRCRRCQGNTKLIRWAEAGDESGPVPLPLGTSREWDSLSQDGKIKLIEDALRSWNIL